MIMAPLEEGWPVDLYEAPDGRCPVRDFLLRLPLVERAKVVALIDRLRAHGPTLPFPSSSQVERKIGTCERTTAGRSSASCILGRRAVASSSYTAS